MFELATINRLEEIGRDLEVEFIPEPLLSRYTTLGVGGVTPYLFFPEERNLTPLLTTLFNEGIPYRVMGLGSNLVVSDSGVAEVVVTLRRVSSPIKVRGSIVSVGGGFPLSKLAKRVGELGLSGLEPLSGIPGSVGGAIKMNAGSFGMEIGSLVEKVVLFSPSSGLREVSREELSFSYRGSGVSQGEIVLAVELRLTPEEPALVIKRLREFRRRRELTQPIGERSAGCIFKNPEGASAGRLIDEAGLKGMRRGGAVISTKHANFIINEGGATASDVFALIDKMKEEVLRLFGIELEEEVEVWGER
ncbi:MAG: UDP-N-acetylmuramate dehydrogenase [Acidobacteria bacterium]|nr:UDP-N-acetylmuramate dehydrogenase [Acidobacteriota bacterium]